MKTFLIIAAVLGVTSSAALADCGGHQVTASAKVDREITTASIAGQATDTSSDDTAVLKRQPVEGQTEVAK